MTATRLNHMSLFYVHVFNLCTSRLVNYHQNELNML